MAGKCVSNNGHTRQGFSLSNYPWPWWSSLPNSTNFNTPSHFVPKILVHKCISLGFGNPFVQTSARLSADGTCGKARVPSSTHFPAKWQAISVCFIASLSFWLCVRSIAELLSVDREIGIFLSKNWWSPRTIQRNCLVAYDSAIYSASQVEWATVRCLRDFQQTVDPPSWNK